MTIEYPALSRSECITNVEDLKDSTAVEAYRRLRRVAEELRSIAGALSGSYAWVPDMGRVHLDKAALDACVDVVALSDIIRAIGLGDSQHAARVLGKPYQGQFNAKALKLARGVGQ